MKNKVIQFLLNEKELKDEELNEIIYQNILENFKSLSFGEIQKIDNIRKDIADIYYLIDILEEKGEN